MRELAWHYTTGENFQRIVQDGILRPAAAHVAPPELPVLWFSMNQEWEPTACKGMIRDGERIALDRWETTRFGKGAVRFGVDPSKLVPWPKIGLTARMTPKVMGALSKVGLDQGSDPRQWFGTVEPIPVYRCAAVDVWKGGDQIEEGQWVRVKTEEEASHG